MTQTGWIGDHNEGIVEGVIVQRPAAMRSCDARGDVGRVLRKISEVGYIVPMFQTYGIRDANIKPSRQSIHCRSKMPDAPKLSTRGASSNKVKKPSKETPRTVHKSKKKLVHSSAPASSKLETVSEDGGGSSESAPSPSAIADLSAALEAADAD